MALEDVGCSGYELLRYGGRRKKLFLSVFWIHGRFDSSIHCDASVGAANDFVYQKWREVRRRPLFLGRNPFCDCGFRPLDMLMWSRREEECSGAARATGCREELRCLERQKGCLGWRIHSNENLDIEYRYANVEDGDSRQDAYKCNLQDYGVVGLPSGKGFSSRSKRAGQMVDKFEEGPVDGSGICSFQVAACLSTDRTPFSLLFCIW